jgi:RNA polymerase sigma factor (sigma-70 family)
VASREQVDALVTELCQGWYGSLLSYATRSCGSVSMAEDLVQETLLSLCRDLLKGAEIVNPKGWTLTVLRHQISKRLEREKDRSPGFEPLDERDLEAPRAGADPGLQLLASDELSHLLAQLTRREEEVILLRLEGLKYAEIGQQLGIHVSSVKTLIARAIQKLQGRARGQGTSLHVESDAKTSRR